MPIAPWTNVYGVARTLLALSTLSSLLLHDPAAMFRPFGEPMQRGLVDPASAISIFTILPSLEAARWLSVGVLLLVVAGWRPRFTGVLHWYVSASFAASCFIVEGGDQVVAILALLLIPITLTDSRRSHWAHASHPGSESRQMIKQAVTRPAWAIIRLQVAVIYFHSSVGKFDAPAWADGTALYYWVQHPLFGAPQPLQSILVGVLTSGAAVVAITWGVILFELLLFTGLVIEKRYRPALLCAGLLFHFGIVVVHGLGSFFLAMAGALVLFLRDPEKPFSIAEASTGVRVARRWLRQAGLPGRSPRRRPIAVGSAG